MAKMCRVLVEELNLKANQIRIYDGKHGADLTAMEHPMRCVSPMASR